MIIEGVILAGGVYCVKKIQDVIIRSDFLPNAPVVKMPSVTEIAESRRVIERNLKMLDVIDVEYEEIPNEPPPPTTPTPNFTKETAGEWLKEGSRSGVVKPIVSMMAKLMTGSITDPISIKELLQVSVDLSHDEWIILRDRYVGDAGNGELEPVGDILIKYIGEPEGLGLSPEENKALGDAAHHLIELRLLKNINPDTIEYIQGLFDFDHEANSIKVTISNTSEFEKDEVMSICEMLEEIGAGYIDRTRTPMIFFFNPVQAEEATAHKPKKEKGPNPKRVQFPGRENKQNQQQPQVRTKG